MHTGGRDLVFMDEFKDEANAALAAAAANKAAAAASGGSGGTASSNINVSGGGGGGFAGAASAMFGASTKSQSSQAQGMLVIKFCLFSKNNFSIFVKM